MGYKVKWVEDNLGVSRKALRNFEKHGLMPPNKNCRYRDYSDEDIDRIWTIRLFQGMGYSLKELVSLTEDDEADFDVSLEKKIKELEEKKQEIERHLGYAQHIKLTGRLPSRPKEMGSMTFGEFYEKSLNEWNINANPETKMCKEIADLILNTSEEEILDTDLSRMIEFFQEMQEKISNSDYFMMEKVIPHEILKRKHKGASDEEIQLLIKILFENRTSSIQSLSDMTKEQFARIESSIYINGDVARMKEREYGKEGCMFIADAIAVFGGYDCFEKIKD